MAKASGDTYEIELHVPNVKLSELNKYRISCNESQSMTSEIKDISIINFTDFSYIKSDSALELNRLISNYTGTLFVDKKLGIDYNRLLPSDLELFSTDVTSEASDNGTESVNYNEYGRAVIISDGIHEILKVQLNSYNIESNDEYTELILELYKNQTKVITLKYVSEIPNRSHIVTLSSQYDVDVVSRYIHEKEDNYVTNVINESESRNTDKYFSTGIGRIHYKVSDCNISYLISDSTKNVLSQTNINNFSKHLVQKQFNSMVLTKQNRKVFIGVPK